MPKKKQEFPGGHCRNQMRKILDNNSFTVDEMRIANEAADEVGKNIFNFVKRITLHAAKLSKHAGRKTLKRSDVELAAKQV